jgi:hypothetical protein
LATLAVAAAQSPVVLDKVTGFPPPLKVDFGSPFAVTKNRLFRKN